jgi:hypothetical protein
MRNRVLRVHRFRRGRCRLFRGFEPLEDRALLATFAVNSLLDTVDTNPGDGVAQDASGLTTRGDHRRRTSLGVPFDGGQLANWIFPLGPFTGFHSEPVDATSVLIAYTRTADANLDGVLDNRNFAPLRLCARPFSQKILRQGAKLAKASVSRQSTRIRVQRTLRSGACGEEF